MIVSKVEHIPNSGFVTFEPAELVAPLHIENFERHIASTGEEKLSRGGESSRLNRAMMTGKEANTSVGLEVPDTCRAIV